MSGGAFAFGMLSRAHGRRPGSRLETEICLEPVRTRCPRLARARLLRRTLLSRLTRRPLLSQKLRPAPEASSQKHLKGGLSIKAKMKVRRLPGLSICQTHKVAPATAKDYVEVFGEVVAFALSVPQFRWDDPAIVDQMLVGLFDDRLLEGVHAGWSGKVFSAMGHCLPAFASGGKSLFPRAKAAQAG